VIRDAAVVAAAVVSGRIFNLALPPGKVAVTAAEPRIIINIFCRH
jgi:hypothetical protein